MAKKLTGFPPVAAPSARVLILGSMPGQKSLDAVEYYAHPRNAFWKIMEACFGISAESTYEVRCQQLAACDIALWDVIDRCNREGSLDSSIEPQTLETNDFAAFLRSHRQIRHVFFNGAKAESVFKRLVVPGIVLRYPGLAYQRLPSTSPAYAALSFEEKLKAWRVIVAALDE